MGGEKTVSQCSENQGIAELSNITAGEYQDAKAWLFYILKNHECERVLSALNIFNGLEVMIGSRRVSMTTIAAGSSLYPGKIPMAKFPLEKGTSSVWNPNQAEIARAMVPYKDIDLFLLADDCATQEDIEQGKRISEDPREFIIDLLKTRVNAPEHVYFVTRYKSQAEVIDCKGTDATQSYKQDRGSRIVPVTVSVFTGDEDFYKRRPFCRDDIVVPPEDTGRFFPPAEKFIDYNRAIGSRFLVLSRQRMPPETQRAL